MDISRVLIIYTRSLYQLYGLERKDSEYLHYLHSDETALEKALEGHKANQDAVEAARATLKSLGIHFDVRYRAKKAATSEYDLVITIGGDGTLLDASHAVIDVPILGVNSSPSIQRRPFLLCDCSHPRGCTGGEIRTGTFSPVELTRMKVTIGDEEIPYPVLNEILFSHPTPGAVTRLGIVTGGAVHSFKSSGIWVATASGSTGAIRSSGGQIHPLTESKLQYRIREPYGDSQELALPRWRSRRLFVQHPIPLPTRFRLRGRTSIEGSGAVRRRNPRR